MWGAVSCGAASRDRPTQHGIGHEVLVRLRRRVPIADECQYGIMRHTEGKVCAVVAIILTYHASERMARRRVSESMIEETICTADQTGEGYAGKLLALNRFPQGLLKVVYLVDRNDHVIISTIWED